MSKNKLDNKAIAEVYEILMLLDDENFEKIPENILETFKEKRDISYKADIQKLMDGEMLQDTKNILCALYYRYLATEEEKKVINEYKQSIKEELEKAEQDLKVGMSEDFFKNNTNITTEKDIVNEENVLPQVTVNENLFTKILNKIKGIFKKNK